MSREGRDPLWTEEGLGRSGARATTREERVCGRPEPPNGVRP